MSFSLSKFRQECKHDGEFFMRPRSDLLPSYQKVMKLPGAWFCSKGCLFHLPFNPLTFPEGITYKCDPIEKKEIILKPSLT